MSDTTQNIRSKTRIFIPDEQALAEIQKHLTPQQIIKVAQCLSFVKDLTGYGSVRISVQKGHTGSKIYYEIGEEFPTELEP